MSGSDLESGSVTDIGSINTSSFEEEESNESNTDVENSSPNEIEEKPANGMLNHLKKFNPYQLFYLIDWTIGVSFIVIAIILHINVRPYVRAHPEGWEDSGIWNYPLMAETFPNFTLNYMYIVPVLVILLTQIPYLLRNKSLLDLHHGFLSLVVSNGLEKFLTSSLKLLFGSYRPNYVSLCDPDPITGECQTKYAYKGAKSFPSGHTSHVFVLMTLSTVIMIGKFGVFSRKGGSFLKLVIALLPLIIAVFVSVSRFWDYFHRPEDIVGGFLVGVCSAAVGYLLYFRSFFSDDSHLPKDRFENMKSEKFSGSNFIKALIT